MYAAPRLTDPNAAIIKNSSGLTGAGLECGMI